MGAPGVVAHSRILATGIQQAEELVPLCLGIICPYSELKDMRSNKQTKIDMVI